MNRTAVRRTILSPQEASSLARGKLVRIGKNDIQSVVADSRQVERDSLFVALPGSRVDGHAFIPEAVQRGASAIIASSRKWRDAEASLSQLLESRGVSLIVLEDTLSGLQELAGRYLERFSRLVRIGVTGSNGKTTTKEILGYILSLAGPTVISPGNLNSEIGLPLSCFRVRDEHRFAVFEMGINHEGEMDILADIFRPDAAVITNIGSAHIGNLGSRQAIAREKKKIFRHFSGTQKAFLYEEEYYYSYLSEGLKGTVVPFGPKCTKGFEGSEDLGLDGNILHWEGLRIRFPLFGAHNVRNALASLSVSAELGISKSKIKDGLECTRPLFGRSQIINGAVTVIQDCYNSNPDSVGQVFAFLSSLVHGGAKIAVLGSMKELGTETEDAHRRIGVEVAKAGFRGIFLFGEEMETAWTSVRESGYSQKLFWTLDIEKLRKELLEFIEPGDLVLIKGSRSVELERLVPDITRP